MLVEAALIPLPPEVVDAVVLELEMADEDEDDDVDLTVVDADLAVLDEDLPVLDDDLPVLDEDLAAVELVAVLDAVDMLPVKDVPPF